VGISHQSSQMDQTAAGWKCPPYRSNLPLVGYVLSELESLTWIRIPGIITNSVLSGAFSVDRQSSERIDLLRFLLIVGVVFVHAHATGADFQDSDVAAQDVGDVVFWVQNYISQVVARISVPLFYLMSGYLFFYTFSGSASEYFKKLKSRLRTLLIPLIFWNLFVLGVFILLQAFPTTANFFKGSKEEILASFTVFDYLNAIFGTKSVPIAYQFWFIRDLIVIVLLTPLINLILKHLPYAFLTLLGLAWFFEIWRFHVPSAEALLFFSIGAFLAIKQYRFFAFDAYEKPVFLIYLGLSIADVLTKESWFNDQLHRLGIVFGILSIVCLTKHILEQEQAKRILLQLSPISFFIFAAHEPFLTGIQKVFYKVFNSTTDLAVMTIYFASPIIVIAVCIASFTLLNAALPRFTKLITGGR